MKTQELLITENLPEGWVDNRLSDCSTKAKVEPKWTQGVPILNSYSYKKPGARTCGDVIEGLPRGLSFDGTTMPFDRG